MKRILGWSAAIVAIAVAAIAGYGYQQVGALDHEQVTGDVFMITGVGGNVGVLRTEAGAVIVDTMTFTMQGERIRELAEELTGQPVAIVVNTHYHQDHTHGNPAFADGARVVATERTRAHMLERDGDYWEGDAAAAVPSETFSDEHTIELGGKTIRLVHPGRGHTDGDLVALFVEDRVIHLGDLLFNGRYPNIDLEAGGTVKGWPATLDRAGELEFDRVIPGHGPLTDRSGIARFREFLVELWDMARDAAERGLTLDRTLESVELTKNAGMEAIAVPFILRLDRDFVVRRAWEEATR
jgi:glyoxylase-like metal-dependent hydrolase (beta-lactamase superfamily II)